jgi:hypothetical protein
VFAGLCCFVAAHANVLSAPDAWLGTWIHSETYCCHIDITEICSTFEEARTRASLRNTGSSRSILALYHFKHGQTLYLHDEVFSQGGSAHSECSDILPTTWAMRSPNGSSLSGSLVRSPGMGSRSERREVEG